MPKQIVDSLMKTRDMDNDSLKCLRPTAVYVLAFLHIIFFISSACRIIWSIGFSSVYGDAQLSSTAIIYNLLFILVLFGASIIFFVGKSFGWWCSVYFNCFGIIRNITISFLAIYAQVKSTNAENTQLYFKNIGYRPFFTYISLALYLVVFMFLFKKDVWIFFKLGNLSIKTALIRVLFGTLLFILMSNFILDPVPFYNLNP